MPPTIPPPYSTPPHSTPPSPPYGSTPPPLQPTPAPDTFPLAGYAQLVGPASACSGSAGSGQSLGTVSTDARGTVSGTGVVPTAYRNLHVAVGTGGSTCKDAFTGLELPFQVSAPWTRPETTGATVQVAVTPTTRLLAAVERLSKTTAGTTSTAGVVSAAYKLVGVDATGGEAGALATLKKPTATERLVGIRMLMADTALTSLVITATAAVSAVSGASSNYCPSPHSRFETVFSAIASSASNGVLDLTSPTLCAAVVKAATEVCASASAAAAAQEATTWACQVYDMAAATLPLSQTDAKLPEAALVPLQAVALAARVAYVSQAIGAAVAAQAMSGSTGSVTELRSSWITALATARIDATAIAEVLGMGSMPAAPVLALSLRASGALSDCPVSYRPLTEPADKSANSNARGLTNFADVRPGVARAAANCRDAALSVGNKVVRVPLAMRAMLPPAFTSGVVCPVATLVMDNYLVRQAQQVPRPISADDYAAVYNYFGVGVPGAADALPSGADFVRQNWPDTSPLVVRAYLLNLRLLSAVGPASSFISGLLKSAFSARDVADSFFSVMSRDLQDKRLRPDDADYLVTLMGDYYRGRSGGSSKTSSASAKGGLSEMPALKTTELDSLLASVAAAVAEVSSMLVALDKQVAAAAAAGTSIDVGAMLLSAAKVSSVAQSSLTSMLTDLAAAASSGDAAALAALQNQLASSFSAAGLAALVQAAVVDESGIGATTGGGNPGGGNPGGTNSTTQGGAIGGGGDPTNMPPPAAVPAEKKKSSIGLAVGAAVGGVVGAAAVAATVALVVIRKRRAKQHVRARSDDGAVDLRVPDPEATGGGATSADADGLVAADSLWPSNSGAAAAQPQTLSTAPDAAPEAAADRERRPPSASPRSTALPGSTVPIPVPEPVTPTGNGSNPVAERVEVFEEDPTAVAWASPRGVMPRLTPRASTASATPRERRWSQVHPSPPAPFTGVARSPDSSTLDESARWWANN